MYLNNASTTECSQRVVNRMQSFLEDYYGDVGTHCELGELSTRIYNDVKIKIANILGCKSSNIFYTSSGSEANNWVVHSIRKTFPKGVIATTETEHPSLYNSITSEDGHVLVLCDEHGRVNLKHLESVLKKNKDVKMFATHHGSNVTGNIQPIKEISKICKKYDVLLMVDACQSFGKVALNVDTLGVDFLSITAHKVGGAKGIASLYAKDVKILKPLIHGSQENGLRGGTPNVALIAGFGELCDMLLEEDSSDAYKRLKTNIKNSASSITAMDFEASFNTDFENCLPHILSVTIKGLDARALEVVFGRQFGIAISSGVNEGLSSNRALRAMGLTLEDANSTIRISLCKGQRIIHIQNALYRIQEAMTIVEEMEF